MNLDVWLASFRKAHEQARGGGLSPAERDEYQKGRNELARLVVAAQQLTLKPGETPRQALRVAKALQLDLALPGGSQRSMTQDLSIGGFSAYLAKAVPAASVVAGSLRLPGGAGLLALKCRVVDCQARKQGNYRVAFAFEPLPPDELEKLELVVFDAVLEQLRTL
ncbi:MAG: PilZ domain-containing protein [Deltaproteobacteria bacterium]